MGATAADYCHVDNGITLVNWFSHSTTTDIKENIYLKKNTTPTTTPATISTTAAPTPPYTAASGPDWPEKSQLILLVYYYSHICGVQISVSRY